MSKPKTLVLSFHSLVASLANGEFNCDDFTSSLYYFANLKTEVLDSTWRTASDITAALAMYFPDKVTREVIHSTIIAQCLLAQCDTRLVWHNARGRRPSFTVLSKLLVDNGFEPLGPVTDPDDRKQGYLFGIAQKLVTQANPSLRVICPG